VELTELLVETVAFFTLNTRFFTLQHTFMHKHIFTLTTTHLFTARRLYTATQLYTATLLYTATHLYTATEPTELSVVDCVAHTVAHSEDRKGESKQMSQAPCRYTNTHTHIHTSKCQRYLAVTSVLLLSAAYCNTATHCSTLQHTATHCNTLQHTATH